MAKSEYTDLTYFMIYGYKLVKNSDYKAKASESELLEMLPHKWKLNHPETIITKEEQ